MSTLFLFPESRLAKSPSSLDNLLTEDEYDLRILGCELIQSSGLLLKLPQTAMATAQVLFHRFYYSKSFVRYSYQHTAMACVVLASKIEEAPKRIRDVCRAFQRINQLRKNEEPTELVINDKYVKLKNEVVKAERRILKELGFCVYVNHPHNFIVSLLSILKGDENQKFLQTAWSYMNDGLRTDVFLRYSPETIACSCVYLSARILGIPLPESPAWWEIFLVTEEDIRSVCRMILKLYTRSKPNQERLESVIDNLRKGIERSRSNIMKQLGKPHAKKIKIEHMIQDAKRRAIEAADASTKDNTSNDKHKKIHERNHSRSPRRSRSRSRERRKYSSKEYPTKEYSSSKNYSTKEYSSKDHSSKDYYDREYDRDYNRDYQTRDYSSSKEYYDKDYASKDHTTSKEYYDRDYSSSKDYYDEYDDYYKSKKLKERDRGSNKDSLRDREYRSGKSKYRH